MEKESKNAKIDIQVLIESYEHFKAESQRQIDSLKRTEQENQLKRMQDSTQNDRDY
jgi:hypothetical protein